MKRIFYSIVIFPLILSGVLFFLLFPNSKVWANPDTETLRPNGAGSETSIANQYPASTFHWDKVDEAVADDDTTYVLTNLGTWERDLYALPAHTGSGTINSVTVYARLKTDSPGSYGKISIKTENTVYDTSAYNLTLDWANYSNSWATNPKTGLAWTWDEADALEAGISLYGEMGGGEQSILAGQPILMADGSQKNIEDINVDDEIFSYNLDSQKTEKDKVSAVMQGSHDDYLVFNGTLKTSTNHIIWANGGFKEAKDIKAGDFLLNSRGQQVEVTRVQHVLEKVDTYNLSIEKNHNFFIGNYLVHNAFSSYCTQVYVVVDYTAGDTTPPTVSVLSPADNATAVAIDSNLVITFSEAVDAETGNISLYKTTGDVLVQAFNVTTDITGTGTAIITANPTSNLLGGTNYYVKIDATAFDDAAGNSFAGIADTTTWNFTTAGIGMSSTNYKIALDSLNNAGGDSQVSSSGYKMKDTVGEVGTGESASSNYKIRAGYRQMEDNFYISINVASDVNLGTISGFAGGIATGDTTWTVVTDNPAGYSLSVKAGASPALSTGTYNIADYTPAGGVASPDFDWSIGSVVSEFGFSPYNTASQVSKFKNNGTACNSGSIITAWKCWFGFLTGDTQVANRTSSTTGENTNINFQAEINTTTGYQEDGAYTANITATAVSN